MSLPLVQCVYGMWLTIKSGARFQGCPKTLQLRLIITVTHGDLFYMTTKNHPIANQGNRMDHTPAGNTCCSTRMLQIFSGMSDSGMFSMLT